jgi:CheY-like chemotaxis protein
MSTVLIIESDARLRGSLADWLAGEGYSVLEAADGRDGRRLARERRPGAVLLALSMSRPTGFDILDTLARSEDTCHIPVVGITALEPSAGSSRTPGSLGVTGRRFDTGAVLGHLASVTARIGVDVEAPRSGQGAGAAVGGVGR